MTKKDRSPKSTPKRGWGEGSISEISPGVWRVRVSAGRDTETGRYRMIERKVRGTEVQAKRTRSRLLTEVSDGKITAESCTVKQLLDRYVQFCETRSPARAPNTIRGYRQMATWLIREIGTTQIRKLTGTELDDLTARIAKDRGASSADHYYRFLRAALNQAVKWRLLGYAPTAHATAPGQPPPRQLAPTPEVMRQLIARAEQDADPDLASLIFIAVTTGMRRGELCGLRVGDVDLERSELVVQRSVSVVKGVTHVRPTKTNKVRRFALDPLTLVVLDRQIRKVTRDRSLVGAGPSDPYLWTKAADHLEPKPPSTVTQSFNRVRDVLGLEGLHFHDIRHLAASELVAAGVDIVTAAARLGHSPTMMLKTYAQVIPARDQEAAAILGRVLGVPKGD